MIQMFNACRRGLSSLVVMGCVLAILAIVSFTPVPVQAEKQIFRFRPAAETTYLQTLVTTRVRDGGSFGTQTEVVESKVKVEMDQTDTGYSVVVTPISITVSQNGEVIDNPLTPLMLEMVLTYELDQHGQLLDIRGFDKVPERMQALFAQDVIDLIEPMMNPQTLFDREAADWIGRIGIFVGQEFQSGDVWAFRDLYTLSPGVDVTYYSAIQFGGQKQIRNRNCVQIISHYNTDPTQLGRLVESSYPSVADAFGEEALRVNTTGVKIAGRGERWVDPATMLVYNEVAERTIEVTMMVEGVGDVVTTLNEKKEYSFEFLP